MSRFRQPYPAYAALRDVGLREGVARHMHWALAFILIPAVCIFMVWSQRIRLPLMGGLRAGYRAVNALCALLASGLDLVLAPRASDGHISPYRLIAWGTANLAILLALATFSSGPWLAAGLAACCALLAVHLLLLVASICKINEENRIMQQGLAKERARFDVHAAVRDIAVIGQQIVIVLVSASMALELSNRFAPGYLLEHTPSTVLPFFDYLLVVFSALPFMGGLVNVSEFADQVTFAKGPGQLLGATIYVIGSSILIGTVTVWIQQLIAINAIVTGFEEAEGEDMHFLQLVVNRAPPVIKREMIRLALRDGGNERAQRRAIMTVPHLRIWSFPHAFLGKLHRFSKDIKNAGINKIADFLEGDGERFSEGFLDWGLRNALRQARSERNEEGVRAKLAALAATYATLRSKQGHFSVRSSDYGVMLDIAKTHKDGAVRGQMADVLMKIGPKGFFKDYLNNMQARSLGDFDVTLIGRFRSYLQDNLDQFSSGELTVVRKRLNFNIFHAELPQAIVAALRPLKDIVDPRPDRAAPRVARDEHSGARA
jgi:hypothetical protein